MEKRTETEKILTYIKAKSEQKCYNIIFVSKENIPLYASKAGGLPYWDKTKELPKDENGIVMALLAQINFSDLIMYDDEKLPKKGLLQFFISKYSDLYGLDYDNITNQKNFRVVYHEDIDKSFTQEQSRKLGFDDRYGKDENGNEIYLPIRGEIPFAFEKDVSYISLSETGFDELFAEAIKNVTGKDFSGSIFDYFEDNDEEGEWFTEHLNNGGHKIFGHPFFTQSDPRSAEDTEYYDTLLFQLDSESIKENDLTEKEVLWGDLGIGNFFINSKALLEKDFKKVLYNWDCG